MMKLKMEKFETEDFLKSVKGLRIYEGVAKGFPKYMIVLSKSKGGKKWVNDDRKEVNFGLFKSIEKMYSAQAVIIGKFKLCFIKSR